MWWLLCSQLSSIEYPLNQTMGSQALVHICDLNTQDAEAGESEIQSLSWLHNEFKDSLGYVRLVQAR